MIDAQSRPIYVTEKLAAYAQLFPADSVSIAALRDLESWFRKDHANREHRDWDDTLAIAFGVADPQDLPAIVARAHTRIRMGMSDLYLSAFTKPLLRRLQVDAATVEAFKAALIDPMGIREDSPIFASPWDPIADACPDLQPLQRTYLFAVVLRQAGALPQHAATAAARSLASASPDTVVHNPFTDHEGPLRLAVLDLTTSSHMFDPSDYRDAVMLSVSRSLATSTGCRTTAPSAPAVRVDEMHTARLALSTSISSIWKISATSR